VIGLLVLALLCALWAGAAAVMIANDLKKRGMPVSYVFLRVMILKYLHQYSKITQEETGRVGPLFYHYVIPLNAALALVIITAIIGWP
jgi:hypothetical protein